VGCGLKAVQNSFLIGDEKVDPVVVDWRFDFIVLVTCILAYFENIAKTSETVCKNFHCTVILPVPWMGYLGQPSLKLA